MKKFKSLLVLATMIVAMGTSQVQAQNEYYDDNNFVAYDQAEETSLTSVAIPLAALGGAALLVAFSNRGHHHHHSSSSNSSSSHYSHY